MGPPDALLGAAHPVAPAQLTEGLPCACGPRFYATTTFQMVGMGVQASLISSVVTNLVNLPATLVAVVLVDRCARPRRPAPLLCPGNAAPRAPPGWSTSPASHRPLLAPAQGGPQAAVLRLRLLHGTHAGRHRLPLRHALPQRRHGHTDSAGLILCMCVIGACFAASWGPPAGWYTTLARDRCPAALPKQFMLFQPRSSLSARLGSRGCVRHAAHADRRCQLAPVPPKAGRMERRAVPDLLRSCMRRSPWRSTLWPRAAQASPAPSLSTSRVLLGWPVLHLNVLVRACHQPCSTPSWSQGRPHGAARCA